jgi:hypothetical protein
MDKLIRKYGIYSHTDSEIEDLIEKEKQFWLSKIKRNLDKRVYRDKEVRNLIIKDLEIEKCCLIDNFYIQHIHNHWTRRTGVMDEIQGKIFKVDKELFEKTNGLAVYSSKKGDLNIYMINKWYKECKDEILKRL